MTNNFKLERSLETVGVLVFAYFFVFFILFVLYIKY